MKLEEKLNKMFGLESKNVNKDDIKKANILKDIFKKCDKTFRELAK